MLVKDLNPNQKVDEIVLTVESKGEERTFLTRWGAEGRVCNAVGIDSTGDKVNITLWNDEIDQVKVNSKIKIINGYAKLWDGELQVSAGRYGRLEVLE